MINFPFSTGLLFVVIALLAWRGPRFAMVVTPAGVRRRVGRAPRGFVQDAVLICVEGGIPWALIVGLRNGRRTRLLISWNVPRDDRQRFRNAMGFHA